VHKKILLFILTVSLFSTTLLADPILNIEQPIRTLKVTSEQMKSAIIKAATAQEWVVTPLGEGQLSATYRKRDYMAKIAIRYAPTFYTINYADSTRMRYKGTSIHPTYNKLIKALQLNIINNLKTGNFATQPVVSTPPVATATTAKVEVEDTDIRAKLKNIKTLFVDGLITQDEYDAKRKALIESY